LAPSERYAKQRQRRHKKLTDWGRQVLLQTARWLPGSQIIGVADSSYASIDLLNAVRSRVCMITRLRLDARIKRLREPICALPHVDCYRRTSLPQVVCYRRTQAREATDGTADQHGGTD